MFVRADKSFDHQKLFDVTYVITKNLNRVIDINYYPVERQWQHKQRQGGFSDCLFDWGSACRLCSHRIVVVCVCACVICVQRLATPT